VADGIVVSGWLDGTPAMLQLAGRAGARVVGRALGEAWRQLQAVDVAGLGLDDTWANPATLAAAAGRWLETDLVAFDARTAAAAARRIQAIGGLPPLERGSFVHGDLVPANLLLRPHGTALLDLESARIGDPLLDAAWCRWIVRYHHPELAAATWAAFTDAAGLRDDPGLDALLDAYAVARILELVADQERSRAARERWVAQLRAALARNSSR
jgi:aminoglycoside phosphotransferase (APT) family kinase protein